MPVKFLINIKGMKKCFIIVIVCLFHQMIAEGQKRFESEEDFTERGFKKENLFTGGGLQLSFANSTFVGGLSPVLGYSINKFLDAGVVLNFTFASNNHVVYEDQFGNYYYSDDRLRQFIYGPGAFVRFYPIKFLFIQALGEINFISEKISPVNGPVEKSNTSVPSLLPGIGYAGGRMGERSMFYYISLSFDVLTRPGSPYVETLSSGRVNALPIIKAGIQIPLFQGGGLFNR